MQGIRPGPLWWRKDYPKLKQDQDIYENESKIGQSRKTKPSTPNDLHTNQGISTTENLDETEQKEAQNEKWKRMFKIQPNSEPSYLAIILDADSKKNVRKLYPSWSNGDEEGVSHSSSAQRVYYNEDNRQCEDNKIQKDPVPGSQNKITEMLCMLVKKQSTPQVDLEPMNRTLLNIHIFCQCSGNQLKKKLNILKVD